MTDTTTYYVNFPGLGIEDLRISRVAFTVANIPIYWYGLLIASAIMLCLYLSLRQSRNHRLNADDVLDVYIAIIPTSIIMARLYYVAFEWPVYANDWKLIFDTRAGGLAFYGGVIGGVLAAWVVTRFKKIPFSYLADFLIVYLPLGQAIGRWGNFFNQEAFGNNTTLPWGMISSETTRYLGLVNLPGIDPSKPVHPTFFYEFLANVILFALLLTIRSRSRRPYTTVMSYLIGYGLVRFFVESIRTDALYIQGTEIRVSMVLSAVMVVGGLLGLILIRQYINRHPLPAPVDDTGSLDFNITGDAEADYFRDDAEIAAAAAARRTDAAASTGEAADSIESPESANDDSSDDAASAAIDSDDDSDESAGGDAGEGSGDQ